MILNTLERMLKSALRRNGGGESGAHPAPGLDASEKRFAVVTGEGVHEHHEDTFVSHGDAMRLAERCQSQGKVAHILHTFGGKRSEVDRYPLRG
jgi:hypothetical protein